MVKMINFVMYVLPQLKRHMKMPLDNFSVIVKHAS